MQLKTRDVTLSLEVMVAAVAASNAVAIARTVGQVQQAL